MKNYNHIALSGHAKKWIDIYAIQQQLRRNYCISQLGCYGWTYADWWNNWPNGREQMQADYNLFIEFIKRL